MKTMSVDPLCYQILIYISEYSNSLNRLGFSKFLKGIQLYQSPFQPPSKFQLKRFYHNTSFYLQRPEMNHK